jgi:hypothetical protein
MFARYLVAELIGVVNLSFDDDNVLLKWLDLKVSWKNIKVHMSLVFLRK